MPVGRRGFGAERPSWARGALLGCLRKRPSHTQSCFPAKENTLGVGFRLQRPPAKQQGPGSQRQPSPALPDVQWRAGCINGLRAFLSKGAVGLVLLRQECFLSLCRLQHQGAGLVPLGRQSLEAERPSLPRGHYWGLGIDGLLPTNPASP